MKIFKSYGFWVVNQNFQKNHRFIVVRRSRTRVQVLAALSFTHWNGSDIDSYMDPDTVSGELCTVGTNWRHFWSWPSKFKYYKVTRNWLRNIQFFTKLNFWWIFRFLINYEYPSLVGAVFLSAGIYDFECSIWPKNIHSELWKFGIVFHVVNRFNETLHITVPILIR